MEFHHVKSYLVLGKGVVTLESKRAKKCMTDFNL